MQTVLFWFCACSGETPFLTKHVTIPYMVFFKVFKRVLWWSLRVSTPFTLLFLILLPRHTIFLWLKTGTLQKKEPYQINVVHILLSM